MKAAIREDLEKACRELQGFLAGKTREDLQHDRALQLIVEREFEIIGEAHHRLQGSLRPAGEPPAAWKSAEPMAGKPSAAWKSAKPMAGEGITG